MSEVLANHIVEIIGMIGACFTMYAAIRSDLAKAISKAEEAISSANKAHDRIDSILNNRHTKV